MPRGYDKHAHHHRDEPGWDEMYARQELRADLAQRYWDIARGRPGFRIADVGSGPGFFTIRFAAFTGPTGHVHAVDVSEGALESLLARLDPIHHAHVTTEVLDVERAPLPDLSLDLVFCTDMLHHVDDVPAALRHLRASGAPLVIAEFDPSGAGDIGPPLEERLAPEALVRMLRAAGWRTGPVIPLAHEHYAIRAEP
ncbi:MAG TPA: class I SAM-dependent methyltransferase [Candidatus Thermoplasmatota archaeon]|nr:class I SAM-dependent methyltransferase [Candidatus Thermoplasmatota archaeon]